jgi:hypothetical protein
MYVQQPGANERDDNEEDDSYDRPGTQAFFTGCIPDHVHLISLCHSFYKEQEKSRGNNLNPTVP